MTPKQPPNPYGGHVWGCISKQTRTSLHQIMSKPAVTSYTFEPTHAV